jgi:hypothetical protein
VVRKGGMYLILDRRLGSHSSALGYGVEGEDYPDKHISDKHISKLTNGTSW